MKKLIAGFIFILLGTSGVFAQVKFTEMKADENIPLFPDKKEPHAEVKLLLLYPADYPDQAVLQWIRLTMYPETAGSNPRAALDKMMESLGRMYADAREFYAPDMANSATLNYQFDIEQSVELNTGGFVVIRRESYQYTGGAHGNGNDAFYNFDLAGKRELSMEDIFSPRAVKDLATLLENRIRRQEKIPAGASLMDHGFWGKTISIPVTFALRSDGILFVYNTCEIRPYSFGITEVFFEWKEIESLIKPDSPVRRLFAQVL